MKLIFLFIIASLTLIAQTKPVKPAFIIKVNPEYLIWYGYELDSSYLNVNLPNGDLPRRSNRTYLYWKADSTGNLREIHQIRLKPKEWILLNKRKEFWE